MNRNRPGRLSGVAVVVLLAMLAVGLGFGVAADTGSTTATTSISGCTVIDQSGEYELAGDLSSNETCIEIRADDVTLDGNGHTVAGDGAGSTTPGILVKDVENVTIRNASVTDWGYGVEYDNASDVTISTIEFSGNREAALLYDVTNGTVRNANVSNNDEGLVVRSSRNVTIRGSTVASNDGSDGIYLTRSDGVTVRNTNVTGNARYGLFVDRVTNLTLRETAIRDNDHDLNVRSTLGKPEHFRHDVDTSNTVGGDPIYYLVGETNVTLDESDDPGYVAFVDSRGMNVSNVTLSNNGQGVLAVNSTNVTVHDVTVANNTDGAGEGSVVVVESRDVEVTNLTARDNPASGVSVRSSRRVLIEGSTFEPGGGAVAVMDSPNVTVRNTTIGKGSGAGLEVWRSEDLLVDNVTVTDRQFVSSGSDDYGIVLKRVHNATVRSSRVERNADGGIILRETTHSELRNNTVRNNYGPGIYARSNSNHNRFADNLVTEHGGDHEWPGLKLYRTTNNTLTGNDLRNNTWNLAVRGLEVHHFVHDVDTSNTVGGDPVYYLVGESNVTVDETDGAGFVAAVNSTGITAENLDLSKNSHGVLVVNSTDVTVRNNTVSAVSVAGVDLYHADNATVSNNTISDLIWYSSGVQLDESDHNDVVGNEIGNSSSPGIEVLSGSSQNLIADNRIHDATGRYGIVIRGGSNDDSPDNVIEGNELSNVDGDAGIYVNARRTVVRDNVLRDVAADSYYDFGAIMVSDDNATLAGNRVENSSHHGIAVDSANGTTLRNNTVLNSGAWDFYAADGSYDTEVTNLTLATATVDFEGRAVKLRADPNPPADPGGYENVSQFVDVEGTASDAWIDLAVQYTESDVANVTEPSLSMWRYNESAAAWREIDGSGVNTTEQVVYAHVENFSTVAPMAAEGAYYEVGIDANATDDAVTAGENVTVTANVTNVGDATGNQSVEFLVNGTLVETRENVTLAANETATLTFEYETGSGDVPEVVVQVSSEDDAANTTVEVAEAGDLLDRQWSFETGSRSQYSTPAVGEQLVYVGGLNETLYALYRSNGTVAWQFDRAGSLVDSSPALRNETVYVGSGLGTVYALDATDGSVVWKHEAGSAVVSSPTVADGTVYVGSNDGTLLALDAADGSVEWSASHASPIFSQPAVANGTVFVTTDGGSLVARDAATGTQLWSYETGAELGHASPSVANGTVYLAADRVYALDAADGSVRWDAAYGGTAGSTPAVSNGTVYVGSADGNVYALAASDGSIRWTYDTGGSVGSSPAVFGDRVVVGSTDGRVYVLDADAGTEVGNASLGSPTRSSPAVSDDEVYLGSRNGSIVAYANVDATTASVRGPARSAVPV